MKLSNSNERSLFQAIHSDDDEDDSPDQQNAIGLQQHLLAKQGMRKLAPDPQDCNSPHLSIAEYINNKRATQQQLQDTPQKVDSGGGGPQRSSFQLQYNNQRASVMPTGNRPMTANPGVIAKATTDSMLLGESIDHQHQKQHLITNPHAADASRISDDGQSESSSASNSSGNTDPDRSQGRGSETTSRPRSGEVSSKNQLRREQIKVFLISYFTNLFSLVGLSFYFVTSTFYDDNNDDGNPDDRQPGEMGVTLPEIQVVLLATAAMYFVLGSTLEYIRHVELKIIMPLVGLFGLMKIAIGIYDIFVDLDLEIIVVTTLQFVHFIVILRLAISMVFITALAKWFSRTYLHLIMGAWFTNEFVAFEITRMFYNQKNYLIAASGFFMVAFSCYALYAGLYRLDPIDAELIVHEQALNLTSQYTDTFRNNMQLDEFIEQMKSSKFFLDKIAAKAGGGGSGSNSVSIKKLQMKELAEQNYEEKVLKRWKTFSLLQTLRLNGVLKMLVCNSCLFFKYRILNKFVVIINTPQTDTHAPEPVWPHLGMVGCFLLSSELIQILFGYMILKWGKGRRYMFQALLLAIVICIEVAQVVIYLVQRQMSITPTFESLNVYLLTTAEGIIVYSLYYMMCMCGPVDMSKIEMLKANIKVAGMLFGVLCGFQCIVQALFLDELIDRFLNFNFFSHPSHFYTISAVNMACTLIAFLSILGTVQEEIKELRTFKLSTSKAEKRVSRQQPQVGLLVEDLKRSQGGKSNEGSHEQQNQIGSSTHEHVDVISLFRQHSNQQAKQQHDSDDSSITESEDLQKNQGFVITQLKNEDLTQKKVALSKNIDIKGNNTPNAKGGSSGVKDMSMSLNSDAKLDLKSNYLNVMQTQ